MITLLAPMISRRRRDRSPIFVVAPSLCLPPVECWRGVSPSQAAKSRPLRNAEAICEAAQRPTMRFVPVKNEETQGSAMVFRIRELLIRQRTQAINALHGHLGEFGQIVLQGAGNAARLIAMIEDPDSGLPTEALATLDVLVSALRHLETEIGKLDVEISRRTKGNEVAPRLMTIPGIGPLIERPSPNRIADMLNREGIPGPRNGKWDKSTIHGNPKRGTGILNNEIYIGRLVWNRQSFVKDPATGKRQARPNPESEWITTEVPDLRIVDQDLWDAVKARQEGRRIEQTDREAWERRKPRFLLTGLVKCGCCGGGFSTVGKDRFPCACGSVVLPVPKTSLSRAARSKALADDANRSGFSGYKRIIGHYEKLRRWD